MFKLEDLSAVRHLVHPAPVADVLVGAGAALVALVAGAALVDGVALAAGARGPRGSCPVDAGESAEGPVVLHVHFAPHEAFQLVHARILVVVDPSVMEDESR